ncbi:MAG: hypothetical protein LBR95_00005, partial [Azoarcus sp.]|nr:hypothetical protein [Azoarcus sp.]
TLITGTVQAGLVMGRLSDEDDQEQKELMEEFCEKAAVDQTEINDALEKQVETLTERRDKALAARNLVQTMLNNDKQVIWYDCGWNLQFEVDGHYAVAIVGGGTCAGTNYQTACSFADYATRYKTFYDAGYQTGIYQAVYEAESELDENKRKIEEKDAIIANTQPSVAATRIASEIAKYREDLEAQTNPGLSPSAINTLVAKRKEQLEQTYAAQYQAAVIGRTALVSQQNMLQAAVNTAIQSLDNREAALAAPANPQAQCSGETKTLDCAGKYKTLCGDANTNNSAYWLLTQPVTLEYTVTREVADWQGNVSEVEVELERKFTSRYYVHWLIYQQKQKEYLDAETALAKVQESQSQSPPIPPCQAEGDGKVLVWSVDAAKKVLRQVDKRSILQ